MTTARPAWADGLAAPRLPREAHVAIVGGGLVGLELAKELHRRGVAGIVVLEAGPVADPRHINVDRDEGQARRLWSQSTHDPHFHRPWVPRRPPQFGGNAGLRRRLGGRSLYWSGVVLPIEPTVLQTPWWPASVVRDLRSSWLGGISLYERLAVELDIDNPLTPRPVTTHLGEWALTPLPRAVRTVPGRPGRWTAYSPLDYWRDPVTGEPRRRSAGVDLVCDVEVLAVQVDRSGAASGLQVRPRASGKVTAVHADAVVLCAGAIESARLAIQAMAEVAPERPARLPGLMDHLVQGFTVRLGPAAPGRWHGIDDGAYLVDCTAKTRTNLVIVVRRTAPDEMVLSVQTTGEMLPSAGNTVACIPGGRPPWVTHVHALPRGPDRDVVRGQRALLAKVWKAVAERTGTAHIPLRFGDFLRPRPWNGPAAAVGGAPETWSEPLGCHDHEGGTLPFGRAVDDRHELHLLPRLFAAGPATFPRMGAANPALTALALAHRLSGVLAADGSAAPREVADRPAGSEHR